MSYCCPCAECTLMASRLPVDLDHSECSIVCCSTTVRAQYIGLHYYQLECCGCKQRWDLRTLPGCGVIRRRERWRRARRSSRAGSARPS